MQTYIRENGISTFAHCVYLILLLFVGNEDMHKRLDELKFRPVQTPDYGDSYSLESKNRCIHFYLGFY